MSRIRPSAQPGDALDRGEWWTRFGDPQLSLQFVRNLEDVDAILGDAPSPDREVMRIKQYIDFAFIASYASLFIALSLRGWQAGGWRRTVGIAAMLVGLAIGRAA